MRIAKLCLGTVALALFAALLMVLSARLPGVVERNRSAGVDATGLFYTDSELALRAIRGGGAGVREGRSADR